MSFDIKSQATGACRKSTTFPKLRLKEERARPPEVKMKNKALLLVVLTLQGCAILRGMGEDIQSLGRALKRAVSE